MVDFNGVSSSGKAEGANSVRGTKPSIPNSIAQRMNSYGGVPYSNPSSAIQARLEMAQQPPVAHPQGMRNLAAAVLGGESSANVFDTLIAGTDNPDLKAVYASFN